jgi:hypothetical protein
MSSRKWRPRPASWAPTGKSFVGQMGVNYSLYNNDLCP